jgi:hypothetical protein
MEFQFAQELIHSIKQGDVNSAKEHLEDILDDEGHDRIVESPQYVYALRSAIDRNDPLMCRVITNVLHNSDMVDAGTVIAASIKHLDVFMAVVGTDGHCLKNPEFTSDTHPLLSAASVGNFGVVKFIVDWIRDGGGVQWMTTHLDIEKLKINTIKQAAMSNSVSICKLIATRYDHKLLVFKMLVMAGFPDSAKRMVNDVDFAANNFELLKVCAPYPSLMEHAMQSESLKNHRGSMPTTYSQLSMYAAENSHDENVYSISQAFKNNLRIEATRYVLETGCSTREAVTNAHAKLSKHYTSHLNDTF